MTQVQDRVGGGTFLTRALVADDMLTRDELTDEQRLFGQTAAEFMKNEVVPNESRLYAHDWVLTRQLLKKAADLDLLRLEIPEAYGGLGLDKISAAYVGEQIAINPSFGGSLGAHTSIGTLPIVYFGTEEQKARYLPRLASGELIGAYALTEPHSGSDALSAKTTARLSEDGKHYLLNGQKAWITNGGFADVFTIFAKVDGEKFTAFIVERGMGVRERRGREEAGPRWIVNDRPDARQRQGPGRERAGDDRRGPQSRVQHPQSWSRQARHAKHFGRQAGAQSVDQVRQRSAAVRKAHLRVRPGQAQAG